MREETTLGDLAGKLKPHEFDTKAARFMHKGYGKTGVVVGVIRGKILAEFEDDTTYHEYMPTMPVEWPIEEEKEEPKLYAPAIIQIHRNSSGKWERPRLSEELFVSLSDVESCFNGDSGESLAINEVKVLQWPHGEPQELNAHKYNKGKE